MSTSWETVAEVQHGLITRMQLRAAGRSEAWIAAAAGRGLLVRVGRGLYRVAGSSPSWMADLWSAVLAAGPYAFAFRRSGAVVWGLDGFQPGEIEVAVGRGRHARRGTAAHRIATLRPGDVVAHDGLRTTSPLRTLFDLAALGDADLVERALESALRRRLVMEKDVRDLAPPAPSCGCATWGAVLTRRPAGSPATESYAETRFLQLCRSGGLPEPRRQHELRSGRRVRLDFAWLDIRLAVEIDGRSAHGPEALGPDLRRQNHIVLDGWMILRFTFEDVVMYPDATIEELRRAFRLLALRPA